MRKKSVTFSFGIKLALAVGFVFPSINMMAAAQRDTGSRSIPLKFTPVAIQPLKKAQPNRGWKSAKTVKIKVTPGREAFIHLYVDPSTKVERGENLEVHAFVQDGRRSYDVGYVSSYGVNDVIVEEIPPHGRRGSSWAIHGALGAAGDCTRVIGFDTKDKRWERLLDEEGNRTELLDLDRDGEKEILSRFGAGADITIFRWRLDHFESVSITKALKTEYARLFKVDAKWILQAGSLADGEPKDARYFTYQDGRLVELDAVPGNGGRKYF